MFCEEWCLVKHTNPGLTVIPLRCKCWSCEHCRAGRANRLIQEALAGKPTLFITLTSPYRAGNCPHAAAQALVRAWRRVRYEYMQEHGKGSLPFLCVFEATKNGWPHIHIVARCKWLSQKWLSKRMRELIGAPIVDVRRVQRTKDVAKYVAKYIGKNPHPFEGVKRYWRSLDYLLPADDPDDEEAGPCARWEKIEEHWLEMVRQLELVGFVAEIGRNEATLLFGIPP